MSTKLNSHRIKKKVFSKKVTRLDSLEFYRICNLIDCILQLNSTLNFFIIILCVWMDALYACMSVYHVEARKGYHIAQN